MMQAESRFARATFSERAGYTNRPTDALSVARSGISRPGRQTSVTGAHVREINMIATRVFKSLFRRVGLEVSRWNPLEEQIPGDYLRSPFLPAVYSRSVGRLFYFRSMFERLTGVPGDIVECGVSTGHGILYWALLCELGGTHRTIWG